VPRLVLPASLAPRLPPEQWRTLLAHELAHWRRCDHWVRWLELLAIGLYWWCPLVWWAKRELGEAEEECCDAWVVTTHPGKEQAYALALVETVDFLSGARAVLPPMASGVGHIHLLHRRVTMILRGQTPHALTVSGLLAVLALGLFLLPLAPTWAQAPPAAGGPALQKDDKVAEKPDPAKAREEFQKAQEDLIKLQRQMQDRRREFEEKLAKEFAEKQKELSKRMQDAMRAGGFPGGPGGFAPGGPGFPGAFPGGLAPPAGLPGAPGNFPNVPQPGLQFPPGGAGGFPFPGQRPDLERRLDDLERKLDKLIERLGAGKGPGRPADPNAPAPPAAPQLRSAPPPAAANTPARP
jgi:hypothetical protein